MAPNLFEMLGIPSVGGGLQDFGSFGAQQPNVAQATSPAPRPGIQNMAGLMPDRQAALTQSPAYAGIQSRLGQIGPKQNDLLESLNKGPGVSKSTAMINGVMTLLPLIMGLAVAKKRGGVIGGQFGMQMGQQLNADAEKKSKDEYEKDKFQYDLLKDESKTLGDRAFQLEKDATTGTADDQASIFKSGLDLQNDKEKILFKSQVDPEKGTTIHMPGQAAELSPDQQKRADDAAMQIDGIAATIRDIDTIIPNWREQTPIVREDGSLDIDRMIEGAAQKVSYKLFGAQTEQDLARAKVGRMLAQRLKLISGTAASDAERLNSSTYMVGDGILAPAAWPVAMYLLETEKNDQKRIYQGIHANASQGRMTGPQARAWADEIEKTAVGDRRTKLPEGLAPKLDAPGMVNTIKDGIKKTIADAPPGLDFQGLRQWKADNGIS